MAITKDKAIKTLKEVQKILKDKIEALRVGAAGAENPYDKKYRRDEANSIENHLQSLEEIVKMLNTPSRKSSANSSKSKKSTK